MSLRVAIDDEEMEQMIPSPSLDKEAADKIIRQTIFWSRLRKWFLNYGFFAQIGFIVLIFLSFNYEQEIGKTSSVIVTCLSTVGIMFCAVFERIAKNKAAHFLSSFDVVHCFLTGGDDTVIPESCDCLLGRRYGERALLHIFDKTPRYLTGTESFFNELSVPHLFDVEVAIDNCVYRGEVSCLFRVADFKKFLTEYHFGKHIYEKSGILYWTPVMTTPEWLQPFMKTTYATREDALAAFTKVLTDNVAAFNRAGLKVERVALALTEKNPRRISAEVVIK